MSQRERIVEQLKLIAESEPTRPMTSQLDRELDLVVQITDLTGDKYILQNTTFENNLKKAYKQWADNSGVSVTTIEASLLTWQVHIINAIAKDRGYTDGIVGLSQLEAKIILLTYIKDNGGASDFVQWVLNESLGFGQASDGAYVSFDRIGTDNTRLPEEGRCYLGDGTAHILIPGLLTTDTITTPTYSDEPTCTIDGRLDIASGDEVGAITITRAGETWAFYKCDEQSGSDCFDSSGNGNDGVITTFISANFHSTNNAFYSYQNNYGYNSSIYLNGTSSSGFIYDGLVDSSSSGYLELDFSTNNISSSLKTIFSVGGSNVATDAVFAIRIEGDGSKNKIRFITRRQGDPASLFIADTGYIFDANVRYKIKIESTGSLVKIYSNDSELSLSITGSNNGQWLSEMSTTTLPKTYLGAQYFELALQNYFSGTMFNILLKDSLNDSVFEYDINEGTGSILNDQTGNFNCTISNTTWVFIPRVENDIINDIYGYELYYSGEVKRNMKAVNSSQATFTGTEYLTCVLVGTESAVSYQGTSTPSISANRIDFTVGTMNYLLLDNGDLYKFGEGGGSIVYEVVNSNHATINGATLATFWTNSTSEYIRPSNLLDGFEYYDDDATHLDIIRVPYNNDGSKITPTIAGYSKISDNDASYVHNDAESKLLQYKTPLMVANDSENFFFDVSGEPNQIGYTDIVDQVGDNILANVETENAKSDLRTKKKITNYENYLAGYLSMNL